MPVQRRRDLFVDVLGGLPRALAQIARFVAVAQLDSFVLAGGCAGGHRRAAHGAVGQVNIGLDSGIATRIQNLSSNNLNDFHEYPLGSFSLGVCAKAVQERPAQVNSLVALRELLL